MQQVFFFRLFAVILGRDAQSVPRILLQQVTYPANKFALLLHKYRFAQDTRDKPEYDGCWRCWLNANYYHLSTPHPMLTHHPLPQGARVVMDCFALLAMTIKECDDKKGRGY